MCRGKHTEAEMIAALKQMEAGRKAEDVAREDRGVEEAVQPGATAQQPGV